ncbi:MAG: GIY-YIG nuclease family protein [Pseudomonadota bacterium]
MTPDPLEYRDQALSRLTNEIGCYVLADLDNVPVYVGQSVDGIRSRVRRHLTSARSDIVANRQIDVWEIAFVWAYPISRAEIPSLETALFWHFDEQSPLMNGSFPNSSEAIDVVEPAQIVRVLSEADVSERASPEVRLPRQATHYARLVDHYLVVKKSEQIARAMDAHFERLARYHQRLRGRS